MAMSSDDFKYDGQVTIPLTRHGDEISVWPSNELKGGLAISLMDVEEPRTNVGVATPAEWDAFVAAGNAALGRPAPTSTPLEERLADAARAAKRTVYRRDDIPPSPQDAAEEAYMEALAMVREAGPRPLTPSLAAYFEEKAKVCDKGRAHGQATGNLDLQNCSKAEAETWRHAASLVVESALDQLPTELPAGLGDALPLLVELRSFLPFGRASRLVDLVTCYVADALGVPLPEKSATTQPEKG